MGSWGTERRPWWRQRNRVSHYFFFLSHAERTIVQFGIAWNQLEPIERIVSYRIVGLNNMRVKAIRTKPKQM